jgi:hypothetical protein
MVVPSTVSFFDGSLLSFALARLAQKQIVGLEVPVHELSRVGVVERERHLAQHAHDALGR